MATYSSNTTLKVLQAATSGYVVPSGCYAIVEYRITGVTDVPDTGIVGLTSIITRHFGPGATIPATFASLVAYLYASPNVGVTGTYSFLNGVVFQNSP